MYVIEITPDPFFGKGEPPHWLVAASAYPVQPALSEFTYEFDASRVMMFDTPWGARNFKRTRRVPGRVVRADDAERRYLSRVNQRVVH